MIVVFPQYSAFTLCPTFYLFFTKFHGDEMKGGRNVIWYFCADVRNIDKGVEMRVWGKEKIVAKIKRRD